MSQEQCGDEKCHNEISQQAPIHNETGEQLDLSLIFPCWLWQLINWFQNILSMGFSTVKRLNYILYLKIGSSFREPFTFDTTRSFNKNKPFAIRHMHRYSFTVIIIIHVYSSLASVTVSICLGSVKLKIIIEPLQTYNFLLANLIMPIVCLQTYQDPSIHPSIYPSIQGTHSTPLQIPRILNYSPPFHSRFIDQY